MRLLLDEHYSHTIAEELRRRGVDAVGDYAPLVEEFGLRGEPQFGVIFTDDTTFPRTHAGIGLIVRALAAFVEGAPDDDLLNGCMYLPPLE